MFFIFCMVFTVKDEKQAFVICASDLMSSAASDKVVIKESFEEY